MNISKATSPVAERLIQQGAQLTIQNSLSGDKEVFKPIVEGHIGMYVCGPTVYSDVHLGNVMTFVRFDFIYRYLVSLGYKVRYVRNITDVGHLLDDGEDRISKGARLDALEPMEVVQKYTNGFHEMMDIFNAKKPSIEPRATAHIIEQIDMVQQIIDNGYAYVKNGSVYFDTIKFANENASYGQLSGRKIDDLMAESRDNLKNQDEKNHPSDFAIWMKASEDHLMKWPSPWSIGFPGWHLECSVMSTKYLGKTFDIHGGGNDLKFPHHENEIAQNMGSCQCQPANYWLHTNMLLMNGRKMSKSDGNTITPPQLLTGESEHISQAYSPMALRFFMLQSHYRSTLDLTDEVLKASEKGYKRLMDAYDILMSSKSEVPLGTGDEAIVASLENMHRHLMDDFNSPRALASIFEIVPKINTHKANEKKDTIGVEVLELLQSELRMIIREVLGLKSEKANDGGGEIIGGLMDLMIELRASVRSKKDWESADKIRDGLKAMNVNLKDGKDGTSWTID